MFVEVHTADDGSPMTFRLDLGDERHQADANDICEWLWAIPDWGLVPGTDPFCRDAALEAFRREPEIVITAYAPFASGAFDLLADPRLRSFADNHGVSPGQVVLRWHLQSDRTVRPKSPNSKRMRENPGGFRFLAFRDGTRDNRCVGGR